MSDKNKQNNIIIEKNLEDIMSEGFGRYAKYIIQDRALPDIRDGLKPVQRRILYAMNNLQLFYDRPHKKSARVVGEVIGKYHPHGDSSIYEAMVRMSQQWKNNIPLVDMHGNNGSIDGDSPAAMRYTESRLSHLGQVLTKGLEKNIVKFIPNFDDTESEPTVLPTLIPNLMINGASGIAAGYATNIPTFNFNEIVDAIITRIDSPNCFVSTIEKVMPGPDFPTRGIILNQKGIRDAYETGKGKITIRARMEKVNSRKVIITEIPYETNKSQIVKSIDELKEKYEVMNIESVVDESDRNGICIALNFKNSFDFEFIKTLLYKNTQLQITYPINIVAIKNAKPYQVPILFFLDSFIEHINEVTIKSFQYDLQKASGRKEIIEGLIRAIRFLDDVIYLIRHSSNKENAKENLIKKYQFTEKQAEAIVNLRLYRLSNSDVDELKKELEELIAKINEYQLLISNQTARFNWIKSKLREYKKIFGTERKTEISHEDDRLIVNVNDTIENKEKIIIVSHQGYLKNISKKSYAQSDLNDNKLKELDVIAAKFVSNQRDKVILITNKGKYITIPTFKIEESKIKDMGTHINNIITIGDNEKVIYAFNYDNKLSDKRLICLVTKNNKIKMVKLNSLNINKNIKSSTIMSLDQNDELVSAFIFDKEDSNNKIGIVTEQGLGLVYSSQKVPILSSNASGVKALNIKTDDHIAGIFDANNQDKYVLISCFNGFKRLKISEFPFGNRSNVGKQVTLSSSSDNKKVKYISLINKNNQISFVDTDKKHYIISYSDTQIGSKDSGVFSYKNKKVLQASVFDSDIELEQNQQEEKQPPKTLF